MSQVLDARGLSCPQPALLTADALRAAAGAELRVLVDTVTQVENCTRIARRLGWQATQAARDGSFELTLRKA